MSAAHLSADGRDYSYSEKSIVTAFAVFMAATAVSCALINDTDLVMTPLKDTPVHVYAEWTYPCRLLSIGFYLCTVATTMYRFVFVQQSREQLYLILGHLHINIIGAYSYYCTYVQNFAYVDPWGLAIAPPIYTMWSFTGGELAFLMLIENMTTPLNSRDLSIVAGLFVCIISGAFAVRTRLFVLGMAVSWISFAVCMYGILITVRERSEETMIASTKRANIIRYSFLVFSFGAITLFVNAGIMDNDQLLVCLAAMDSFTKGILTILNLDSQLVRLLSLEGQLVVELEANRRRREFMKYMFHEVRNPLNAIAMGLDYFSALDNSGWADNYTFSSVFSSITELETTLDSFLLIQQMEEDTFQLQLCSTKVASVVSSVAKSFPTRVDAKAEVHVEYIQSILGSSKAPNYLIDIENIQFVFLRMLVNAASLCDNSRDAINVEVCSVEDPSFTRKDILNGKKSIRITVQSMAGSTAADVIETFFAPYTSLATANLSERGYNSMVNHICYRIAEKHGGYMTCDLSENKLYIVQTLMFHCDSAGSSTPGTVSTNKKGIPSGTIATATTTPWSRSTTVSARYRNDSSSSSTSDVRRLVSDNGDSPLVNRLQTRPLDIGVPDEVGALSRQELFVLGSKASNYKTKPVLVALCKHNGIVVVSNNSKADIIQKLQSHRGPVLHYPPEPTVSSPHASVTSEASRASRRGLGNGRANIPAVIHEEVMSVGSAPVMPFPMPERVQDPAPSPIRAPVPLPAAPASAATSGSGHNNAAPVDDRSANTSSTTTSKTPSFQNLRTLVVDDSPMNRKMLQRMLKLFDVPSDAAEDGQIAVDMVKAKGPNHYDVIFMDFTMPVMNGVDATRIIRSMGCTTKIIAVTGNAMEADVQALEEAGANRVILKPMRQTVLQEELAAAHRDL